MSSPSISRLLPFPRQPALRWDNPADARMLRYIEETRGEEMARIMTLPDEEYFREIQDLIALNWQDSDPEKVPEYGT